MTAPRRATGRPKAPAIAVLVEEPLWKMDARILPLIRRAARMAVKVGRPDGVGASLTILLADDARLRALNRAFRGKAKPTNVLSFPAPAGGATLGDIAIAYGVVAKEARAQAKSLAAHAAHLALHGTLHLLGYDHASETDAKAMEELERNILSRLGISDPYEPRPYTRRRKAA